MPAEGSTGEGRSAQRRRAIIEAAATLFLRNGYERTSMDEVAALAAASKQTLYKHFGDKEQLFTAVVSDTLDRVGDPFRTEIRALQNTDDLAGDLRELATHYLLTVVQPQVLQLRRMVIGEAARLPEVARMYYLRAPERTLVELAASLERLAARGLLHVDDAPMAAGHFAFLVMGRALDRSLFFSDDTFSSAEIAAQADAAVRVFLAAYGR